MSVLLTYFLAMRNVFLLAIFLVVRKATAVSLSWTFVCNDPHEAGGRTPHPATTGENHGICAF
jgi:hypothetical protein